MLALFLIAIDSPLIITEVMSNVMGSEGGPGDRNEYVEIYNLSPDTIDCASYFLDDLDANPDEVCPWEDDALLIKYPSVRIYSTLLYPYSYALIMDREYTSTDTSGGYVQPYDIPDSTLIVTTDDTSLGDGLSATDALVIFSAAGCSTTFGTPFDSLDGFPSDPGDGISWERIELDALDEPSNWHTSIDSAGCTPGKENSTTNAYDLAVSSHSIFFTPAIACVGDDVSIKVIVKNNGLRLAQDYELKIFDDIDNDSCMAFDEHIVTLEGEAVDGLDSIPLLYEYQQPSQGMHHIGLQVEFTVDKDPTNNCAFKDLQVVGETSGLALTPRVFSPNSDGIDDELQIDYRLSEPGGILSLLIFDTRGCLCRTIHKNLQCITDRGTVYWNGSLERESAPSGMYVVYLEYRVHNQITKDKKTTVLAR